MPKLIRHDTKDEHELADGVTVIGRATKCQVQVRSRQISRAHCKIEGPAGGWVVSDLGSKVGTFVNGKRVQSHRLAQHDEIKIGPVLLVFDEDRPPSSARLAAEREHAGLAERPRRSLLSVVAVPLIALAAIGAILGLLAMVLTTRQTPTRVVERAARLLRGRDAKALWPLVSRQRTQQITFDEFRDQVDLVPGAVLRALATLEVGDERRVSAGVVVPIAVELDGRRLADEVVLYREDGDWKLHTVPVARMRELAP